jgi:hypothetical protein
MYFRESNAAAFGRIRHPPHPLSYRDQQAAMGTGTNIFQTGLPSSPFLAARLGLQALTSSIDFLHLFVKLPRRRQILQHRDVHAELSNNFF